MEFIIIAMLLSITAFFSERGLAADSAGCAGIAGNTTTIEDVNVDILCDTEFPSGQVYSVLYTATFEDCITECLNLLASVVCVGVQYSPLTLAPKGLNGSLCYLQWGMGGHANQSDSWHSARIQTSSPAIPEVAPT